MREYQFMFAQDVECLMTGFKGKINAVVEWNNGSYQYSVTPAAKEDGSLSEGHWMDHHDFVLKKDNREISREINPVWELEIGDKISVKGTGFIGHIIGKAFYSNRCARYFVRSKDLNEGSTVSQWFDAEEMNKMYVPKPRTSPRKPPKQTAIGGPSSSSRNSKA